jgi:hypothetical protein
MSWLIENSPWGSLLSSINREFGCRFTLRGDGLTSLTAHSAPTYIHSGYGSEKSQNLDTWLRL